MVRLHLLRFFVDRIMKSLKASNICMEGVLLIPRIIEKMDGNLRSCSYQLRFSKFSYDYEFIILLTLELSIKLWIF
jgi:hypothetical protein